VGFFHRTRRREKGRRRRRRSEYGNEGVDVVVAEAER
jgi:hypothetical protein